MRLFSTCIKTSSGDGRPGKYCPTPSTPLFAPLQRAPPLLPFLPLSPQLYSPTTAGTRGRTALMGSPLNDLRPCCPSAGRTEKIMLGLISRRCERAPSEFVNRALWARNKADSKCCRGPLCSLGDCLAGRSPLFLLAAARLYLRRETLLEFGRGT